MSLCHVIYIYIYIYIYINEKCMSVQIVRKHIYIYLDVYILLIHTYTAYTFCFAALTSSFALLCTVSSPIFHDDLQNAAPSKFFLAQIHRPPSMYSLYLMFSDFIWLSPFKGGRFQLDLSRPFLNFSAQKGQLLAAEKSASWKNVSTFQEQNV